MFCLLFFEEFSRLLEQIAAEPSGCLLITGDFNFHMDDPDNANAKRFADLLESYDLKQHVNCGTHTSGVTIGFRSLTGKLNLRGRHNNNWGEITL